MRGGNRPHPTPRPACEGSSIQAWLLILVRRTWCPEVCFDPRCHPIRHEWRCPSASGMVRELYHIDDSDEVPRARIGQNILGAQWHSHGIGANGKLAPRVKESTPVLKSALFCQACCVYRVLLLLRGAFGFLSGVGLGFVALRSFALLLLFGGIFFRGCRR